MKFQKTILATLIIVLIVSTFSSCLPRRRWYSIYKDKNGQKKVEHYNQYKTKWYKKNWYNREIWK